MKVLEWGIYLIVFCLPLYLVRFSVFNLPTNVLEVLVGILFVVWIVNKCKMQISKCKIKDLNLFIPILLILIGVSMATIFSWDLRASAGIWKSWFIVPLLFFVVLINVIEKENIKNIFYSLIASGFVVGAISLIYLIQGNLDIQGRLQGFYNSPNYLAMYLAPALILCSGLLFVEKKRFFKLLLITNYLLLITILFFTKSFGAWLGIIIAFCFGLILYLYTLPAGRQEVKKPAQGWSASGRKKLLWVAVCLSLLIILVLGYSKFISQEGRFSFDARLIIWQKAWQVFKTYPVIGIGPGTFQDYFPLYPKWGVPQPHNLYLAFLLQTGIIGFIGFIWLLTWFFKKGFELLKTQNLLVITIMSTMTYILGHGLVDTTYWKNDLSIIFWLILVLLNRAGR